MARPRARGPGRRPPTLAMEGRLLSVGELRTVRPPIGCAPGSGGGAGRALCYAAIADGRVSLWPIASAGAAVRHGCRVSSGGGWPRHRRLGHRNGESAAVADAFVRRPRAAVQSIWRAIGGGLRLCGAKILDWWPLLPPRTHRATPWSIPLGQGAWTSRWHAGSRRPKKNPFIWKGRAGGIRNERSHTPTRTGQPASFAPEELCQHRAVVRHPERRGALVLEDGEGQGDGAEGGDGELEGAEVGAAEAGGRRRRRRAAPRRAPPLRAPSRPCLAASILDLGDSFSRTSCVLTHCLRTAPLFCSLPPGIRRACSPALPCHHHS